MRSRLFSSAPSLRIELSSRCSFSRPWGRYCGTVGTTYGTSVYLYAHQDPRTTVLDNWTRSVGLKEDLIL